LPDYELSGQTPLTVDKQGIKEHLGEIDATLDAWMGYRNSVQNELKGIINATPPSFRNILRYHMGWDSEKGSESKAKPGKFIRSILHLLSCQTVGGDPTRVLPSAAAVEFVHNLSLIHDDIQDRSLQRRGRPTVWKLWGKSQAINIGDFMFALASLALIRLKDNGVSSEEIVYSLRLLARACKELCEGQFLDIEFENRVDVTVENYLNMIRKKTAALIAVSTSMGAYLGRGSEKVEYFRRFGEALGTAYQIRDDILGVWGVKVSTGKSVAEDLRRKKKTLPLVYALSQSKDKAKLRTLYSKRHINSEDISAIVTILDQSGARDHCQNLVQEYGCRALEQLEASGAEGNHQAPLKQLVNSLAGRDY
jgi:geranylgeranyl diphosphate synthase type I